MVTPELKSLIGAIASAAAVSLMSATPAPAAVLNFAFQVTIDQGPYRGTHGGTFRFDNTRLVPCLNSPNRTCATPGDSGLSILFNFMGTRYTEASDFEYATSKFPAVYYFPELEQAAPEVRALNNPYILSLIVKNPQGPMTENFAVFGNQFFTGFSNLGELTNPTRAVGRVNYIRLPDSNPAPAPSPCELNPSACDSAAVPEPSEIAGTAIALGLFGLFWRSRRKKVTFKP